LAVESMEVLRTQATARQSEPQFPAEDIPVQVPAEVGRLRHEDEPPVRA